jgi:hypothetical protein
MHKRRFPDADQRAPSNCLFMPKNCTKVSFGATVGEKLHKIAVHTLFLMLHKQKWQS